MTGVIRVLVVGPKHSSRNSRGGMATIVGLMREQRDPRVRLTTVATHVDDGVAVRLATACWGLGRSAVLILAGRVDVVHVHLAHKGSVVRKAAPLLLASVRGVPAVVHAHSYDFAGWFDTLSPRWRTVVRRVLPADRWLVLGEVLVAPYRDRLLLPADVVTVLRNPAPPVRPERVNGATNGAANGAVRAVGLGRMGHRKGTYDLLEALSRVDGQTRSSLQVVLAGDGELDAVRAEADRRGLGDVVDVRWWLAPRERDALLDTAEVFLLPSHAEGLPMALLEAMSAGLVPVVSAVGAVGEVVTDDRNAVVVPPGDPATLGAAIAGLVGDRDRRQRLAAGARATAGGLSVQAWFDQLVEIWSCAIHARTQPPPR